MRTDVLSQIKRGMAPPNLFNDAQVAVYTHMNLSVFPAFKHSSSYHNHLVKELRWQNELATRLIDSGMIDSV